MQSLRKKAKECLLESSIDRKVQLSICCFEQLNSGLLNIDRLYEIDDEIFEAGHPEKPILVAPDSVPRRGFGNKEGQSALLHAITHIEFNAINLAWDAVYRFSAMPEDYYRDWATVAYEETQHFNLLRQHLRTREHNYGDFEAHDGLWHMAERTNYDVLVRMALVPRVLEARGLDVTPGMIKKFKAINDVDSAKILQKIYIDEIGHVEIGSRWFKYICEQRNLEPTVTFRKLINKNFPEGLRGPFNIEARNQAGFSDDELTWLEAL